MHGHIAFPVSQLSSAGGHSQQPSLRDVVKVLSCGVIANLVGASVAFDGVNGVGMPGHVGNESCLAPRRYGGIRREGGSESKRTAELPRLEGAGQSLAITLAISSMALVRPCAASRSMVSGQRSVGWWNQRLEPSQDR